MQTPLTLSTSFSDPLYWFTSKSIMLGCPSQAALKTGVKPHCRRHSKDNNKGKSGRECTENMSPQIISTNMAAVVQGKVKNYSASTPTLPTGCFHSTNPTHFNLVHLYYLSHHHTTHNKPQTKYLTESIRIGLVHTHHIRSSGIQLVLVDDKPYHISMSSLSCVVHHGKSRSNDSIFVARCLMISTWPPSAAWCRAFHPCYKNGKNNK